MNTLISIHLHYVPELKLFEIFFPLHLKDVLKPRIYNRHILSLAYKAVFPVAKLAFINNDSYVFF